MAISEIKVTYVSDTSSIVTYTYTPAEGETRTVIGGFFYDGAQNTYDPLQPQFGLAGSARVSQLGMVFTAKVTTPSPAGQKWYFVCGVTFDDGTTDASSLQDPTNAPPQGGAASQVSVQSSAPEIPISGTATITLTAISGSAPTQGRSVNFGFKTGSIKGTFTPPNPVMTKADGTATVTFTPLEPGQAHIEGEADSLTAGIKVKVKN